MRPASLLPLVFSAALVTACGSEVSIVSDREETASRPSAPPERDLTLQAAGPAVEVASPVELSRPRPAPAPARASRPRPKPKSPQPPAPEPDPEPEARPAAEPVAAPAVAEVDAEPAPEDDATGGGRELAPGKTVTIIPVSSGPSVEADQDDSWLPSERPRAIVGGGGGTCRPRGGVRGIGITGRIPVGIPARRLR